VPYATDTLSSDPKPSDAHTTIHRIRAFFSRTVMRDNVLRV